MRRALFLACLAPGLATPALSQAQPDHGLRAYLQQHFREYRQLEPDARYVAGLADLNGDGRPEAVVQMLAASYCGSGGCGLHVFSFRRGGWREISTLSITNAPIRVLNTRSHGWRDLSVRVSGGGIRRGYEAQLPFNGRTYPGNPSVPPARRLARRVPGRVLIAANDRGRPLF